MNGSQIAISASVLIIAATSSSFADVVGTSQYLYPGSSCTGFGLTTSGTTLVNADSREHPFLCFLPVNGGVVQASIDVSPGWASSTSAVLQEQSLSGSGFSVLPITSIEHQNADKDAIIYNRGSTYFGAGITLNGILPAGQQLRDYAAVQFIVILE